MKKLKNGVVAIGGKKLRKFSLLIVSAIFVASCQQVTTEFTQLSLSLDSVKNIIKEKEMRNIDSILQLLTNPNYELDKASKLVLHHELGKLYREKSDFSTAIKEHQTARSIAIVLKDTVAIVKASNQIGTDFRRTGKLAAASEAHFYALNIANQYSQKHTKEGKKLLSFSLNGIGNIYKIMDNKKEALRFFRRSIALDKELNNYLGLAMNNVTIGSILEHQNKSDSAYLHYKTAMHYDSLINSDIGIAICQNRIGQLFLRQKKWDKALIHYELANSILKNRKDVWNKLKTEKDIAWIYIQQRKYAKAQNLLTKLNRIALQGKMYGYLADIQYSQGILYSQQQQYKKSSSALESSINYKDSIKKIQDNKNSFEMRIKFEKETNQKRIQELNEKHKYQDALKRNMLITGSIIGGLLFLLSFLLLYLLNTQKKNNKKLKESNSLRDKIFSIISHDLKNPAIAQKMVIKNLNNKIGKIDDTTLKKYYKILQDSSENQINVIENLMAWASIQTERIEYNPQMVDVTPVVNEALQLYKIIAEEKSIIMKLQLPEMCIVFADKQLIAIVLRNLINNAVKFSQTNGLITIACDCENNSAQFTITDDGVGMSQEQISKLYTPDNIIQPGTNGEKGTGLGLLLCKTFLKYHNSHLVINSSKEKGTVVKFTLPKKQEK